MMVAPTVLDCTIRDGSYAIDFKFTAEDTALIVGLLDAAGLRYIEIGHGLGLGASDAGKGAAPSRDVDVIALSRERVRAARIGAFFIPGIGQPDDLRAAADAGLQFVRIGNNADEMEDAWESVELARELGFEVFVNLMKTYGISPEAFADVAAQAADRGTRAVYVVDSAGGMLPSEVAEYVRASRDRAPALDVGFHGHSNLHLAVANSLAALDAGARFVDTSVYGIGRSSGNVPTEVMTAVLDRLGIDSGVDTQAVIDIAASYLQPLAEHLHPHDMTAVALGLGRFHSSFLPRAQAVAQEEGVDPLRLIVALGRLDMMRMEPETVDAALDAVRGTPAPEVRADLARFSDPRFGTHRIGNRPGALDELVDGLEVAAAKRHLTTVLDVTLSDALDEDELTAEFLLEDQFGAFGRVRSGSAAAVAAALRPHGRRLGLVLLDAERLDPDTLRTTTETLAGVAREGVLPYRSGDLALSHLGEQALAAISSSGGHVQLIDPRWFRPQDVDALAARLAALGPLTRGGPTPDDATDILVVAGPVEAASVPQGRMVQTVVALGSEPPPWAQQSVLVALQDPYRHRLPLWLATARAAAAARPPVAS